jgi:nicotinamide mononucleotide transporter
MVSWLLNAHLHILGADILWREILGNAFGLVSVLFAMQRRIAAWPIGMAGNVLLFTVFLGGVFDTPQDKDLYGQAGRQVMFFAAAVYGWWRWQQNRRATGQPAAVAPHWATWRERLAIVVAAGVGVAVLDPILAALGSFGALADSWIFMGSLLATVAMARGYTEFWVLWIGVDAVGVPLLLRAGYYPSALLYIVYGVVCVWGFAVWWKAQHAAHPIRSAATGRREGLPQLDSAAGRP